MGGKLTFFSLCPDSIQFTLSAKKYPWESLTIVTITENHRFAKAFCLFLLSFAV